MDDIWESIHLDERGSFSFKDMAPEKIEAIRRVAEDARRAGVSVKDWMLKLKHPLAQAEKMQRVVDELGKIIPMEEPYTTTQGLREGEPVNKGRIEWTDNAGNKLSVSKVYGGEQKDLSKIKKMKISFTKEWAPMVFFIKKSGSKVLKSLGDWAIQAEFTGKLQKQASWSEIKAQFKEFTARTGEKLKELGKFLINRQKNGAVRLERMGIDPKTVKDFSGDPIVSWIDSLMKDAFSEVNNTRTKAGLSPIPPLDDYFTFMYSEVIADLFGNKPNRFMEANSIVVRRYNRYKEKLFGSLKPRSRFGLEARLELDPRTVLKRYMEQQIDYKNFTPIVNKINQLSKPLKTGEFRTTPKGDRIEKLFDLSKENPALYEYMRRWGNWLAGQDLGTKGRISSIFGAGEGTKLARGLNVLRRNMTMTMLGANVRTGAIQLTALRNTAGEFGVVRTVGGIAEMLIPGHRKMAYAKSKKLNLRKAELELDEIVRGIGGTASNLSRLSTAHINYIDSWTAASSWLTAYRTGKTSKKLGGKGLSEAEAINLAEVSVDMTQGSSIRSMLAPIQRTAMGKAITLFQTFTISDWNFLYSEIFGVGTKGVSKKQVVRRVYSYILATTAFNILIEDGLHLNSPFPTPIRAAMNSIDEGDESYKVALNVLTELTEGVPGIGSAAKYGSSLLGPIAGLVADATTATFSDPFNDNKMDGVSTFWEETGKAAPIPGLGQFSKSKSAYERGESPLGTALGSRTKKTSLGGLR